MQTNTITKNKSDIEQILKPKVTSNEDFHGDKTHFTPELLKLVRQIKFFE